MNNARRAAFIVVLAIAALLSALVGTASAATVSATAPATPVASAGFPPLPGVQCAQSGPAKEYPSADKTTKRNCWWGYEILFSKDDSHRIVEGASGIAAIGSILAGKYLPPAVAERLLIAAAGGGPITAGEAGRVIDKGTCLKVTVFSWLVPIPGTYRCY